MAFQLRSSDPVILMMNVRFHLECMAVKGSWQVAKRMLENKPVIIHGDGTSLWTMTHNSDFAKGFIGLMGNIHAIGESVHITIR